MAVLVATAFVSALLFAGCLCAAARRADDLSQLLRDADDRATPRA